MALHIVSDKHVDDLLALCYILVYIVHLYELKLRAKPKTT